MDNLPDRGEPVVAPAALSSKGWSAFAVAGDALLAAIVESSDDAIISQDLNGTIRSWNKAAERIFGYTAAEASGQSISILAVPERRNEMPDILSRIARGERVESYETLRRRKDGRIIPVSLTVSPLRNAAGEIVGASRIARDVSEAKQVAEALRRNEAELQFVLDAAPAFIAYLNREGRYIRVNRAYEDWFGLPVGELQGKTIQEAFGPEYYSKLQPNIERVLTGETVRFESQATKADGEAHYLSITYTPDVDERGRVRGFIALVQDLTDRRKIEEELRKSNEALHESEDHYRHTVELSPQAPWTAGAGGRMDDISPQWLALIGLTREEALATGWTNVTHPEDRPRMQEAWSHSRQTGEPFDQEHRIRVADGSYRWMQTRARARRDASGRIIRWYGNTGDIHERKRNEQELRAAYQQFDAVITASPLPIVALTRDGAITLWNPAAERVFGWSAEEVMGQPLPFIPPEKREEHRAMRARDLIGQGFTNREIARRRKDGRLIDLSVSTAPFTDPAGRVVGIMSVYLDITEQKRIEAAREFVERQLLLLVEASGSLLASPHSSQVLRIIVELAQRFISADAYAVWRGGQDGIWRLTSSVGLSEEYVRRGTTYSNGALSLPAAPIMFEDIAQDPFLAGRYESLCREGIRSMLLVPLRIHGEITGTVVFYWKTRREFNEAEVRIAAALGNLAASALGMAELYERQLEQRGLAEASERRAAFLAEAGAVLASSLDYHTTLASVARLAVPAFADWAAVDVLDEQGAMQRVAVTHTDPEKVRFAYEFNERYPPREEDAPRVALRTGQSVLVEEITDQQIERGARDTEHARLIRRLGLKSIIIAPLTLGDRHLGLITFATAESERHYNMADLQTAEELARRAAAAIEHAGLYREVRHSEERYRSLVSATTAIVWTVDPEGRFTERQLSWEAYTGQTWEEHREFGWLRAIHPEDREAIRDRWFCCRDEEKTYESEGRLWHAHSAAYRHFTVRAVPVRNTDGSIREWVGTITDVHERKQAEAERASLLVREKDARQTAELLNRVGPVLAAELDTRKLAQNVTDIATMLIGAQFGALAHSARNDSGESHVVHTLSGIDREAFSHSPLLRNAQVLGPAFKNEGIVRLDDITQDPRFRWSAPQRDVPEANRQVRSYLAASVVSRSGDVLGVLFFGHSEPGRFTEAHQQIIGGIAAQAAIAFDNARLFGESQHTQNELIRINTELRRANADLEQFAYSASHDLKEPLRMVAIYSQLLQRKYQSKLDTQADKYLSFTIEGARRMEALITDLLAYTQVVNVKEENISPVDADKALDQALSNLKGAIEESGASIERPPLPKLLVQQTHLVQLFQNLVGNAIKYRGERPPVVRLTAQPEGTMWRLSVHDNGIGISPEYREHVFGLFKRLHNSERYSGTGIGLAICQKIVHRYGGRIWIESEGPGTGSAFCFTLPGGEDTREGA